MRFLRCPHSIKPQKMNFWKFGSKLSNLVEKDAWSGPRRKRTTSGPIITKVQNGRIRPARVGSAARAAGIGPHHHLARGAAVRFPGALPADRGDESLRLRLFGP